MSPVPVSFEQHSRAWAVWSCEVPPLSVPPAGCIPESDVIENVSPAADRDSTEAEAADSKSPHRTPLAARDINTHEPSNTAPSKPAVAQSNDAAVEQPDAKPSVTSMDFKASKLHVPSYTPPTVNPRLGSNVVDNIRVSACNVDDWKSPRQSLSSDCSKKEPGRLPILPSFGGSLQIPRDYVALPNPGTGSRSVHLPHMMEPAAQWPEKPPAIVDGASQKPSRNSMPAQASTFRSPQMPTRGCAPTSQCTTPFPPKQHMPSEAPTPVLCPRTLNASPLVATPVISARAPPMAHAADSAPLKSVVALPHSQLGQASLPRVPVKRLSSAPPGWSVSQAAASPHGVFGSRLGQPIVRAPLTHR